MTFNFPRLLNLLPSAAFLLSVMADPQEKSGPPLVNSPDVEEHMSIGRYIATRIPTLMPPMHKAPNPFKALAMLNRQQWLFFWVSQHFRHFRVDELQYDRNANIDSCFRSRF